MEVLSAHRESAEKKKKECREKKRKRTQNQPEGIPAFRGQVKENSQQGPLRSVRERDHGVRVVGKRGMS